MFQNTFPWIGGLGWLSAILWFASSLVGQPPLPVNNILYEASLKERVTGYYPNDRVEVTVQRLVDCGPDAIPELIQQLREAPLNSLKSRLTLQALAKWKDRRALPAFLDLVWDKNRSWQSEDPLFQALAAFGKEAEDALLVEAADQRSFRHQNAMRALAQLHSSRAGPHFLDMLKRREAVQWAAKVVGESHVPGGEAELLRLLDEELASPQFFKGNDLQAVVYSLGQCGGKATVDRLLPILSDKKSVLRPAAATACGRLKDPRVIDPLMKVLDEVMPVIKVEPSRPNAGMSAGPPPSIRELAIDSLVALRDSSLPALMAAAAKPDTLRGSGAVEALSRIAAPESEDVLRAVLESTDELDRNHVYAYYGLCAVATERSAEALLKASRESLANRGGVTDNTQKVDYLFKPERATEARASIATTLARLGPKIRPRLIEQLHAPNEGLAQDHAFMALCYIAEPNDFPILIDAALRAAKEGRYLQYNSFKQLAVAHPSDKFREALWSVARSKSIYMAETVNLLADYPEVNPRTLNELAIKMLSTELVDWQITKLTDALGKTGVTEDEAKALKNLLQHQTGKFQNYYQQGIVQVLAKHSSPTLLQWIREEPTQATSALKALKGHHDDPAVREVVAKALAQPELTPVAIEILTHWKWADPLVPFCFEQLRDTKGRGLQTTAVTLQALSEIGETGFLERLKREKKHFIDLSSFGFAATDIMLADLNQYPESLTALAKIGDPKSTSAILAILNDENKATWHGIAAEALGNIGTAQCALDLFNRLENPGRLNTSELWKAISKLPRSLQEQGLRKLIQSSNNLDLATAAIQELGSQGSEACTQILREELTKTKSTYIRSEIERTLIRR